MAYRHLAENDSRIMLDAMPVNVRLFDGSTFARGQTVGDFR